MKRQDRIDQVVESLICESPRKEHDYAYNLFRYNLGRTPLKGDVNPEAVAQELINKMLKDGEIKSDVAKHRGFLKTAVAMVQRKVKK